MYTKSVTVSVPVLKMGVVLHQGWYESQWTVLKCLINILLSQQMLDAVKYVVNDNVVSQQNTASVHLVFNTVQLLQCKTVNFFSPELRSRHSPELNCTDYKI